jgi:hypothetical protein
LAEGLRKEFPATNGFSAANLWRMKNFYEVYGSDAKLAQLVREIGWSHNITILEKCKSGSEREFYIRKPAEFKRMTGFSDFRPWHNGFSILPFLRSSRTPGFVFEPFAMCNRLSINCQNYR